MTTDLEILKDAREYDPTSNKGLGKSIILTEQQVIQLARLWIRRETEACATLCYNTPVLDTSHHSFTALRVQERLEAAIRARIKP